MHLWDVQRMAATSLTPIMPKLSRMPQAWKHLRGTRKAGSEPVVHPEKISPCGIRSGQRCLELTRSRGCHHALTVRPSSPSGEFISEYIPLLFEYQRQHRSCRLCRSPLADITPRDRRPSSNWQLLCQPKTLLLPRSTLCHSDTQLPQRFRGRRFDN